MYRDSPLTYIKLRAMAVPILLNHSCETYITRILVTLRGMIWRVLRQWVNLHSPQTTKPKTVPKLKPFLTLWLSLFFLLHFSLWF